MNLNYTYSYKKSIRLPIHNQPGTREFLSYLYCYSERELDNPKREHFPEG